MYAWSISRAFSRITCGEFVPQRLLRRSDVQLHMQLLDPVFDALFRILAGYGMAGQR